MNLCAQFDLLLLQIYVMDMVFIHCGMIAYRIRERREIRVVDVRTTGKIRSTGTVVCVCPTQQMVV